MGTYMNEALLTSGGGFVAGILVANFYPASPVVSIIFALIYLTILLVSVSPIGKRFGRWRNPSGE
jgi:hypothetical protein